MASTNTADVAEIFAFATSAEKLNPIARLGVYRDEDFSQFKPRGHCADREVLSAKFKAMMWLGRFDPRVIETQRVRDFIQRFAHSHPLQPTGPESDGRRGGEASARFAPISGANLA